MRETMYERNSEKCNARPRLQITSLRRTTRRKKSVSCADTMREQPPNVRETNTHAFTLHGQIGSALYKNQREKSNGGAENEILKIVAYILRGVNEKFRSTVFLNRLGGASWRTYSSAPVCRDIMRVQGTRQRRQHERRNYPNLDCDLSGYADR
jgi:hypothetical protein